jgi:hypothetical protein
MHACIRTHDGICMSRQALLNLDYAVEYIAADNPTAAAEVAQRIWDVCHKC